MPKEKLTVSSFFPATVPIDGYAVDVRIKRMTLAEYGEFTKEFQRSQDPHSARLVALRLPGPEQDTRMVPRDRTSDELAELEQLERYAEVILGVPDAGAQRTLRELLEAYRARLTGPPQREVFVIPDDEIRRRRLVEMTPEQLQAFEVQEEKDEDFNRRFFEESISTYVTVLTGQIEELDEAANTARDITSGEDMVRIYGARKDVLLPLMLAISNENTLSVRQKNVLSSRVASRLSSSARGPELGSTPRPIAESASVEASATGAAATASSVASSGDPETSR